MPAIIFDVVRNGDLTRTCSVNWVLEGDLVAADMAQGQATSGTLTWAANETASKQVTINTLGNTVVNPDKVCRIRISAPVNGTINSAAASTTVIDDDSTTVVKVASTVGLTRSAANIIRPSFNATASNRYTVAANQSIDCRGRVGTQHASGQDRVTPFVLNNCPGGVVIFGGGTLGMQPDTMTWQTMKNGPVDAPTSTEWDDNGIDQIGPTGPFTFENFRIEKAMDAFNVYSEDGQHQFTIRGSYVLKCRDDAIENDHLKPMLIEDCLFDSTHMFLSQRPDKKSLDTGNFETTNNITTVRNCLVRLRRQPYQDTVPAGVKFDGPWNSAADPGNQISGSGFGYSCAWLWKWHIGSGTDQHTLRLDCRDCLFAVESLGTSTTTDDGWPPGTYSNVTVIWLGPGAWPMGTPPGVKVLSGASNINLWNTERARWLSAHGSTDDGATFPFQKVA